MVPWPRARAIFKRERKIHRSDPCSQNTRKAAARTATESFSWNAQRPIPRARYSPYKRKSTAERCLRLGVFIEIPIDFFDLPVQVSRRLNRLEGNVSRHRRVPTPAGFYHVFPIMINAFRFIALVGISCGVSALLPTRAAAQAEEESDQSLSSGAGVEIYAARKLDMQFGMRFQANDNLCSQIVATIAFPIDWPEQRVTVTQSQIPPNAYWQFRDLPPNTSVTARQLVMQIPVLQAGGELEFVFDVEIEKSFINPPPDTSVFVIPKKPGKDLNWSMGNSPMIDANASDIKRLAKTIAASEPPDAWTHVERIYDWVRDNIEYTNGPIRNTREAMKDKKGDCEEMTGIFIAICRASGIPARCVWIPDHCYPEFYLEDGSGKGYWIPCQVAGDRQFGQMHDYRPILQKGDRFKVPEKQGMQHYLSEFFTCKQRILGPREPDVTPILDLGPLKDEIAQLQQGAGSR
jgi:hypothetical protein